MQAAEKLAATEGNNDRNTIDAYVALLHEALPGKKVHVAKSKEEYRPGVINFDTSHTGPAITLRDRLPTKKGDPLPKEPMVVIGPSNIVKLSPIVTRVAVTHEQTHVSHAQLAVKLAKKWDATGKNTPFLKWFHTTGSKKVSKVDYDLIMELYSEKDPKRGSISEILSVLEAFTAHYDKTADEEVKHYLLTQSLNSIARELEILNPGIKERYTSMVSARLRDYYTSLGKKHRRTFDDVLKDMAKKARTTEQKKIYSQLEEFIRKRP